MFDGEFIEKGVNVIDVMKCEEGGDDGYWYED